MTKTQFENLQLDEKVVSTLNPDLVLNVSEICEDERFITQWINRGYPLDTKRIIKLDNDTYHTWVSHPNNFSLFTK